MFKYTLAVLSLVAGALSAPLNATAPLNVTLSNLASQSPTVTVKNHCGFPLTIGYAKDVEYYGPILDVPSGGSHVYSFPINWSGRIWGRNNCGGGGKDCFRSGMGSPATLAEFHFLQDGQTFYDISLVDGYNLPMTVAPNGGSGGSGRSCTTSRCTNLPTCPAGHETLDANGKVAGCKSACTTYQTDELCCTGAHDSPTACKANSYTQQVKDACPDAYSYAYDDDTSVFMCKTYAYTVTFC